MQLIRITAIIIFIKLDIFSAVCAQTPSRVDNDKVFNAARFGHRYISLSYNGDYLLQLKSFRNITVIDARPDTLAIGFRKREIELRKNLMRFKNGLSHQLSGYLRNNCILSKDSNAWSLVIIIKDLWLKEYDVDENENDKIMHRSIDSTEMVFTKSYLKLEFDCYINKSDAYYAAFRFDTVINKFLKFREFSEEYMEYALQLALSKAENTNADSIAAKKRKFTLEEINTYYKKRWDIPILTDSFLRKGVYVNFEEFKTNHPSITNFELKKGKLADVLHADGNPTRDAWGYCDGVLIFIKAGENYYPLIRQEHSFYFLGSDELTIIPGYDRSGGWVGMNGDIYNMHRLHIQQTKFKNILLPMKLNWQTGKPY